MKELLEETRRLLRDLKRCGVFYPSAIELDSHIDNPIDGDEFEEQISDLLKKLNDELK